MKVMLLAAGLGTRMLPLTRQSPKPLLEVDGCSLIERHLTRLAIAGFCDIVVNIHHLGNKIVARLGNGAHWGVRIEYSQENVLLETGGGIKKALPCLGERFAVISADTFTNLDFNRLREPLPIGVQGRLVMVPNPAHHPDGDFGINDEGLLVLADGVISDSWRQSYTWSSAGVFTAALFQREADEVFKLRQVFDRAIVQQELAGMVYDGFWCDVGTIDRYEALKSDPRRVL